MKVLNMKMMAECLIVTRGHLIIELRVSELCVVDGKSNKEAVNLGLFPKFPFFHKITVFELMGDENYIYYR